MIICAFSRRLGLAVTPDRITRGFESEITVTNIVEYLRRHPGQPERYYVFPVELCYDVRFLFFFLSISTGIKIINPKVGFLLSRFRSGWLVEEVIFLISLVIVTLPLLNDGK